MSTSNHPDPYVPDAIVEIMKDREAALRRYYALYRDSFLGWARGRFRYSDDDYQEVFQEAILLFWEKVERYQSNKPICQLENEIRDDPEQQPRCDCVEGKEACTIAQYTCLLKTYLFAVGRIKLLKKNPAKSKTIFPGSFPDPPDFDRILSEVEEEEALHARTLQQLEKAFARLSETCGQLLRLYFFEQLKIPDITKTLGYANDNVTRVQKFRCLDRLKELIHV